MSEIDVELILTTIEWAGTKFVSPGIFDTEVELLRARFEELTAASNTARIDEALHDLSWRATRYAMDQNAAAHDAMAEAYRAVAEIFGRDVADDCDCVASFVKQVTQ